MRFTFLRLSLRKLTIYFLAVTSCILLALNIHQRTLGLFTSNLPISAYRRRIRHQSQAGEISALSNNQQIQPEALGLSDGQLLPATTTGNSSSNSLLEPAGQDSLLTIPDPVNRPWYMQGGSKLPPPHKSDLPVFPEEAEGSDRILNQLMYLPPPKSYPKDQESSSAPLKLILLWNGIGSWGGIRQGRGVFLKEKCPISTCAISSSRLDSQKADLVLFKDHFTMPSFSRPTRQLWMMYLLECPLHTMNFRLQNDVFNWTSTYRSDSTIVAPYGKWEYYNENVKQLPLQKNFAANKTKAVAWFVSNCGARNNRLKYAKELGKHIQVDIYGACGTKTCPRSQANNCFKMLDREYKFYLAFENSNCKDYITEKLFVNGLGQELVPIVMGARPEDYEKASPFHSYIHVDDFDSPKELAEYLKMLDQDDEKYNEYFKWKETGEFVNTKFFCRVCSMLHEPRALSKPRSYPDFNDWWRGKGTCINGSWRKYDQAKANFEKSSSTTPKKVLPPPDRKESETVSEKEKKKLMEEVSNNKIDAQKPPTAQEES